MRAFALFVLFSLLPVSLLADAPVRKTKATPGLVIEGETQIIVTKLPFDVVLSAPADLATWRVPSAWKYEEGDGRITVTAAPEGTAVVGVQTLSVELKDGKLVKTKASYAITVNVGKVAPPTPLPPLPPTPPAKAWVVVIEETAEAQVTRRAYYADPSLNGYVKDKGWKMRVTDKDVRDPAGQPPRDLAPYLALARGKPLPWLWVVDQAGTVRADQALPPTPAELTALLRKIGG